MRSSSCRGRGHEYPDQPYSVDTGYLQTPEGRRVDGRWLRFRCLLCGHVAERFEAEGEDPESAGVNLEGDWSGRRRAAASSPRPSSVWERPLTLWLVGLAVLALAIYGYYWDSRIRSAPRSETEIVRPRLEKN